MDTINYVHLSEHQKELLDKSEQVMETAYNPYSHFFVGAALRTTDDNIITGSNVENAAYGLTICAERSAILRANAMGYRMFKGLAIIARGEVFDTEEVSASCGSCRQMLYESRQISEQDLEIVLSTTKKDKIVITSEIL